MARAGRHLFVGCVTGLLVAAAGSTPALASSGALPTLPAPVLPADWDVLPPADGTAAPQNRPARVTSESAPGGAPAGVITYNVYASTLKGQLAPAVRDLPARVYVPNSDANSVSVIDPARLEVVDRFTVGAIPHHVAPAYDLSALYVDNEGSSSLTVIDPRSGRPVGSISVPFPYNLYFTPDGSKAVVVVERLRRIEFFDRGTWQRLKSVDIPWAGADHLDFGPDGRSLYISTEFSGVLARVDTVKMELSGTANVGGLPIDVRLAPDGSLIYVANQGRHGVSLIDPERMVEVAFIPTGLGAHGLQVSRAATHMYVSNRLAGTISVIDVSSRQVVATWRTGGSPDMLQLSPDGQQLWASSRFDGSVLVVDTGSGQLIRRIPVGAGAHGLTYFPNAGVISLGHNGVYR